jgi:uncharacterized C2H2 Zn-finger protein
MKITIFDVESLYHCPECGSKFGESHVIAKTL